MITDKEKEIYNLYLKSKAIAEDRPFRYKKNWDKFEGSENHLYCKKLESIFNKYPHFFCVDFFVAPYKLPHSASENSYYLKYYTSHSAIVAYVTFLKLRNTQNPDEQIDYINESLRFIAKFCKDKKLVLSQYVNYKSVFQNDVFMHLKEHKISFYLIFDIPGLHSLLYGLPSDEFELYFGDLNMNEINRRYESSTSAKMHIKKGIKKVDEFLKKSLTGQ
jgi:hypothetical protein